MSIFALLLSVEFMPYMRAFSAVKKKMDINDLTYKINGAIYEVNQVLGEGFLEKVYENALLVELRRKGLRAENQVPVEVSYKGNLVGSYYADIIVEDTVLLELKAIDQVQNVHKAQMINYMKATGIKVGLLVNFKQPKAEIKRIVLNTEN